MTEVTDEIQKMLADIFQNSDRPDKMSISLDAFSRSVTVTYNDIDDQWFRELSDECEQPVHNFTSRTK